MIHIQRVKLAEILEPIKKLSEVHHSEVETSGWKKDPDYELYQELEDKGSLLIHALMDDHTLVGYSIDIIAQGLHYQTRLMARNDMVYVAPEYRGLGFLEMLLNGVVSTLTEHGVSSHTIHLKSNNSCSAIMKKNHYEQPEVVWHRVLEK